MIVFSAIKAYKNECILENKIFQTETGCFNIRYDSLVLGHVTIAMIDGTVAVLRLSHVVLSFGRKRFIETLLVQLLFVAQCRHFSLSCWPNINE